MYQNARPYEFMPLLAAVNPASLPVGNTDTVWVSMVDLRQVMAIIHTGVLGASATLDAKLRQAKDAAGTGAKDVPAKAITQIVKATGDGKQALIAMKVEELDRDGGFTYVGLRISVGVAASFASAVLYGTDPVALPATSMNAASVAQIV